jgi:hypothetical protein
MAARLARRPTVSSTEFIQKEKSADEDGEWNPEVDISGDGTKQTDGTAGFAQRHCSLRMELVESGVPS